MEGVISFDERACPLVTSPSSVLEIRHLDGRIVVSTLLPNTEHKSLQPRIELPVSWNVPDREVSVVQVQSPGICHDPAVPFTWLKICINEIQNVQPHFLSE